MKLNVRAGVPETRKRVLGSIRRIIDAEAAASGATTSPTLTPSTQFPFLYNDSDVTKALEPTFTAHFGAKYNPNIPRLPGSEDFGILATSINKPSCFFLYGGLDPKVYDKAEKEGRLKELPGNHSPYFVPQMTPSLTAGMEGYIVAALTFLGKSGGSNGDTVATEHVGVRVIP